MDPNKLHTNGWRSLKHFCESKDSKSVRITHASTFTRQNLWKMITLLGRLTSRRIRHHRRHFFEDDPCRKVTNGRLWGFQIFFRSGHRLRLQSANTEIKSEQLRRNRFATFWHGWMQSSRYSSAEPDGK